MRDHCTGLSGLVVLALMLGTAQLSAQADQSALAHQLLDGNTSEQMRAAAIAEQIGSPDIGQELRSAILTALEREGLIAAERRRGEGTKRESSELIARLALLATDWTSPQAIPGLTLSLGKSPPAIEALAQFGEPAAGPVMDVIEETPSNSVLMDGLRAIRLVEGVGREPLRPATLERIRTLTAEYLTGDDRYVIVLRAIDLAIVLDDPELRTIVESMATDRDALMARGITDPRDIRDVQEHAARRLNGEPPRPQCCTWGATRNRRNLDGAA